MKTSNDLKRERANALEEMSKILGKAVGRSLTQTQQSDFDAAEERSIGLTREIIDAEEREFREREYVAGQVSGGGRGFRTSDELLGPTDSFVEYLTRRGGVAPEHRDLSLGRTLRGLATGHWDGADAERAALGDSGDAERRAQGEGTVGAGGAFVPTILAGKVIDAARAQAVCIRAGAFTLPMESATEVLAKVTGDPAAAWRSENATISAADFTFNKVTLTAQSLAVLTLASRELMADAVNLESTVITALAEIFAAKLDLAVIQGSGTPPEPLGIKGTSGIGTVSMGTNGAAPANFDPFIDAITLIRAGNLEPNAVIFAPRTAGELAKLKDTVNQPMAPPADYAALRKFSTSQIPLNETQGTSSLASSAYVGKFDEVIIGMRQQLEIRFLLERYADANQIGIVASLRADVQIGRPVAFTRVLGIL